MSSFLPSPYVTARGLRWLSGLLACGVALFSLTGCKKTREGAKIAPKEAKAPELKLSASAEAWQNLLADADKLAPNNGASVENKKLTLTSRSSAKIRESAGQSDGAIRLVGSYQPSSQGVAIVARMQDVGLSSYNLAVTTDSTVRLGQKLENGQEVELKLFTIQNPLSPSQPYELELRVVGSTLTASLNGKKLGDHSESTLNGGMMGVSLDSGGPIVIAALEYLPLGNSTPVSTGATEQWTNVMDNGEFLAKTPALKKVDDGFEVSGGFSLLSKPAKNCAVRVTMVYSRTNSGINIAVRSSKDGNYSFRLNAERGYSVRIHEAATKSANSLLEASVPGTAPMGEVLTVELRAVGARVTVKINDEEVGHAEDTKFKEGQITISGGNRAEYGTPKIVKVEYAVMD